MSLVAHALAIVTTGALIEQLPSWVRVALEPHEPADLAADQRQVVLAVFVGDETTTVENRKWSRGKQTVELVVQVLLPPIVEATVNGRVYTFDTAQGGARSVYALVHEAMRRAFTLPSSGTWAELLQRVWVSHPEPLHAMPGKAEKPGKLPVAVMDYSIPCACILPPPIGEAPPEPWPQILAKMQADPAFTEDEAAYFEALIAGVPLSEKLALLALAGLPLREGRALGLGPMDGGAG